MPLQQEDPASGLVWNRGLSEIDYRCECESGSLFVSVMETRQPPPPRDPHVEDNAVEDECEVSLRNSNNLHYTVRFGPGLINKMTRHPHPSIFT